MNHSIFRSVAVGVLSLVAFACPMVLQAAAAPRVVLLTPDDLAPGTPALQAWLDAAAEEGYVVSTLKDADFLAMGAQASVQLAAVIVPDGVHTRATGAVVKALDAYTRGGGRLMVVFDAASLTDGGFFAVPRARLSDLVGVDYVLYDELRERTVGLGPIKGAVSVLRDLQVPPGKSMPLGTPTVAAKGVTTSTTSTTAAFIAASAADPGAMAQFDAAKAHRDAAWAAILSNVSKAAGLPAPTAVSTAGVVAQQPAATPLAAVPNVTAVAGATEHVITGYGYGPLTYPSYVTRGVYAGQTLLASEQHGLVAGRRKVDKGEVMFVNLPLSALKLGTDGLPMHGTLSYFMSQVVQAPRLLSLPNGRPGITLNWHLDSNLALAPMQKLDALGVWQHGPFSMHMTAGPDTIQFGDKIGFDLPNNKEAQRFLRLFKSQGHQVGSHGGWIHDYYGLNVADNNQAEFEPLLVKNRQAVDVITGTSVEYSAPTGSNPQWTVDWNEKQGVKSLYFLGHTGLSATRFWRDGDLHNPKIWAIPVTPYGASATFEEFQRNNIPAAEVLAWYKALVDFNIKYRTSRMVYMHPPGAMMYPTVVTDFLNYVRGKAFLGKVQWYTFTDLAQFMSSRQQVSWTMTQTANGALRVDAQHPGGLSKMTWALPKSAYQRPSTVSGIATIDSDDTQWLVKAWDVKSLSFKAQPVDAP
jgi:hypothetical protein